MRPKTMTEAHKTEKFAELVCSNSFGSLSEVSATGQLATDTGGRPAELFRYIGPDVATGSAPGLAHPGQR